MPSGGVLGIFFATSSISHSPTMSEPPGCGAIFAAFDADLPDDSKFALRAPTLPGVFAHPAWALGTKATLSAMAPSVVIAVCNSFFTLVFISNLLESRFDGRVNPGRPRRLRPNANRKSLLYRECVKSAAGRSRMVVSGDLK